MFNASIQAINATATYEIDVSCEDCMDVIVRLQGFTHELDEDDDDSILNQLDAHTEYHEVQERLAAKLNSSGVTVIEDEDDYHEYNIRYDEDEVLRIALCQSCLEDRQRSFQDEEDAYGDEDGESRAVNRGTMRSITAGKHIF